MITQFKGEDRKEAIVNHFSLDISEEDEFFEFVENLGYSADSSDEILENLHKMFSEKR